MKVYLAGPHEDDVYRAFATGYFETYSSRTGRTIEVFDPIKARDFRGKEITNENEIVQGDLLDIVSCDVVLGNYSVPGWGTGMETWFARSIGRPVVAYVSTEARVSPWVAYVAGGYAHVHRDLRDACLGVLAVSA